MVTHRVKLDMLPEFLNEDAVRIDIVVDLISHLREEVAVVPHSLSIERDLRPLRVHRFLPKVFTAAIVKLGMMTGAEITHDDSTEITQISAALKLVLLHKHLMETEKNKILSYLLA
jgi:hypothetical protein